MQQVAPALAIALLCVFAAIHQTTLAEEEPSTKSLEDDILTPAGEVTFDYRTGKQLPEEMDDGELEGGDHHIEWSYGDQQKWGLEYPLCKGLNLRQSPIDIRTDIVQLKPDFRLEFIDYDQEVAFQLKNTHHSVSLSPVGSVSTPSVRLSWLADNSVFELQEIHFHWGDGVNKGSEHEINGERAAAEMHMVHYKKGIDKTDIGNVENSVIVIGVLIESDNIEHRKLEALVESASSVNGTDTEYMTSDQQSLINLLPDHHQSFYTYNGSLTTPPCYEVVTWVVMSEPVNMANERLIELANLEANNPTTGGKHKISANHRDVQPLLDRSVYVSFNTSESNTIPVEKSATNHKFRDAFEEYWSKIRGINSSVRKAFGSIETAREKLLGRLGITSQQAAAAAATTTTTN